MKGITKRTRSLVVAALYLLCAVLFFLDTMGLASIASDLTKLKLGYLLVVRFGMTAACIILAIGEIRAAWRKERPQQREDDDEDEDDDDVM